MVIGRSPGIYQIFRDRVSVKLVPGWWQHWLWPELRMAHPERPGSSCQGLRSLDFLTCRKATTLGGTTQCWSCPLLLLPAAPSHCQMPRDIEAARNLRRGFLGSYHVFFYLLFDQMGRDTICYSKWRWGKKEKKEELHTSLLGLSGPGATATEEQLLLGRSLGFCYPLGTLLCVASALTPLCVSQLSPCHCTQPCLRRPPC